MNRCAGGSLTWLADAHLLQVGLLDVGEVLDARDVEAVADAQVELLQLHLSQQLVQPLRVLVHQRVTPPPPPPPNPPCGGHSPGRVKG